jgi:hypothetical protein
VCERACEHEFKNWVVAGSYGSLARFRDERRMKKVGDHTLIGASGDISDFQAVMSMVEEMQTLDMARDDGCCMTPRDFHQYLGRVMYNRCPCVLRAVRRLTAPAPCVSRSAPTG